MKISDVTPPAARELVATSRSLDPSIAIVVCIPCFRRPQHLRLTLESLARQRTDRRFAVVMVDNDAVGRESAPVASEFLEADRFAGLCVVEPRQGNCHAINAAFETALASFPTAAHFLMIDDDEIASADWLERMVGACETTGADLVGGPVLQNFDDELKRGLQRHPAFRPAYDTSGPVPVIYGSGNCLITRPVFAGLADPAFDLRFNFLGGGDTDFFVRCRQAGMKFHWAAEAVITETVPHNRTSTGWIAKPRQSPHSSQLRHRAYIRAQQSSTVVAPEGQGGVQSTIGGAELFVLSFVASTFTLRHGRGIVSIPRTPPLSVRPAIDVRVEDILFLSHGQLREERAERRSRCGAYLSHIPHARCAW